MEVSWPACAGGADADGCDAWVEVSQTTVDAWREQAWRGSLDEAGREPRCGGSSSDDGLAGPGTASMSGESLRSRDASMSGYGRCAPARGAPAARRRHKVLAALHFWGSACRSARAGPKQAC